MFVGRRMGTLIHPGPPNAANVCPQPSGYFRERDRRHSCVVPDGRGANGWRYSARFARIEHESSCIAEMPRISARNASHKASTGGRFTAEPSAWSADGDSSEPPTNATGVGVVFGAETAPEIELLWQDHELLHDREHRHKQNEQPP